MLHHERLRPPSRDYPADEWNVIEKAFHPEFLAQLETMSALGNGYLGMRGCPEEGGPNAENGTFINGFYETRPIVYGEDAYGFARTGQTICNVTDSKIIKLFVDDEPFWLSDAHLLRFDRRLNMAPATRPAIPAMRTSFCVVAAAATPTIKLAVETIPSLAPKTAALSQPMRSTVWYSGCR